MLDMKLPICFKETGQNASYAGKTRDGQLVVRLDGNPNECVICSEADLENVVRPGTFSIIHSTEVAEPMTISCNDKRMLGISSGSMFLLMQNGDHKTILALLHEMDDMLRTDGSYSRSAETALLGGSAVTVHAARNPVDDGIQLAIQSDFFWLTIKKSEQKAMLDALDRADAEYDRLNAVKNTKRPK